MLSQTQLNSIADQINAKVDLPFLGENQEKQILMSIIGQAGSLLSSVLPQQYHAMLGDPNAGVDKAEATAVGNGLMEKLTSSVNMDMFGSVGKSIASTFVESIVNGLQKGGTV